MNSPTIGAQNPSPHVVRHQPFNHQVVIVDGQPGCGKTLFTSLISSFDRVEIMNYSTEVETVCQMYGFGKVTDDAAQLMIQMKLDEICLLYTSPSPRD